MQWRTKQQQQQQKKKKTWISVIVCKWESLPRKRAHHFLRSSNLLSQLEYLLPIFCLIFFFYLSKIFFIFRNSKVLFLILCWSFRGPLYWMGLVGNLWLSGSPQIFKILPSPIQESAKKKIWIKCLKLRKRSLSQTTDLIWMKSFSSLAFCLCSIVSIKKVFFPIFFSKIQLTFIGGKGQ